MKNIGSIAILSLVQKVVLTTPEEVGDPSKLNDKDWSAHCEEQGRILLNKDFSHEPTRVRDNVVHEAVHGLIGISGARNYLQGVTGAKGEAWDEIEENLVRMLGPALNSCLDDLSGVCNVRSLAKAIK